MRILAGAVADARGERRRCIVNIEAGRIGSLAALDESAKPADGDIDARDGLLVPGFIDIHVHGGAGRYLMEGTLEAVRTVAAHLAAHGVTGFLATTITAPWPAQRRALEAAAECMAEMPGAAVSGSAGGATEGSRGGKRQIAGAAVLGCHLEGPYINPAKKGAQPGQFIRPPSAEELQREAGDYLGAVRVMTLAPEMPGGMELTRFLASRGIVASIGHTTATYAQACAAIDAGARHVTHCFNAMRPLDSREPGTVGAALSRSELAAELIWDNIHVHPASCRALVRAKGADRVILISDGIPGAGMPDGYRFSLGDLEVRVTEGSARLPDGTLAGSLLTLDRAFANAAEFPLPERCAMTSFNAAAALGLSHRKGLIAPGYDADLTALDADGTVAATIVGGTLVYRKPA